MIGELAVAVRNFSVKKAVDFAAGLSKFELFCASCIALLTGPRSSELLISAVVAANAAKSPAEPTCLR